MIYHLFKDDVFIKEFKGQKDLATYLKLPNPQYISRYGLIDGTQACITGNHFTTKQFVDLLQGYKVVKVPIVKEKSKNPRGRPRKHPLPVEKPKSKVHDAVKKIEDEILTI